MEFVGIKFKEFVCLITAFKLLQIKQKQMIVQFSTFNYSFQLQDIARKVDNLFKDDVQSVLRTLENLFAFFVLSHVRHHKM